MHEIWSFSRSKKKKVSKFLCSVYSHNVAENPAKQLCITTHNKDEGLQAAEEIETSRLELLDIFSSPRKPSTRLGRSTHHTNYLPPTNQLKKFSLPNALPGTHSDLETTGNLKSSSTSTLIYTPTLNQFKMAYNSRCDCIICTECEIALPFNSFVDHAYTGVIIVGGESNA